MTDDLPVREALTHEASKLDLDAQRAPALNELLSRADTDHIWADAEAELDHRPRRALLIAAAVLLLLALGGTVRAQRPSGDTTTIAAAAPPSAASGEGPTAAEVEAAGDAYAQCMADAGYPLERFSLSVTQYDVSASGQHATHPPEGMVAEARCQAPLIEISEAYTKAADPPFDEVEQEAEECMTAAGFDPPTVFVPDIESLPDDHVAQWGRCMSQAQNDVLGGG